MNTPSPCDKCMFLDYDGWNDYSQSECRLEAEMGKSDCPHFVHWNSDSKLKLPIDILRHLKEADS